MTTQNLATTLQRISVATPESPIVVFNTPGHAEGDYNTMFAQTVRNQKLIKNGGKALIGVFHNELEPEFVKDKIQNFRKGK